MVTTHVSVILLAAGRSQRMGKNKALLPLGAKLLIQHCLDSHYTAGLDDITVVLRDGSKDIAEAISTYPLQIVINQDPASDMAGSIRCGLGSLNPKATGVLISLVDHPLVQTATLKKLIICHDNNPGSIILPVFNQKKGHPTLFPKSLILDLFQVPTLRDIVHKNRQKTVSLDVDDRGVILDTDLPEDYQELLDHYQQL